jgi:predicted transcriptional regulator
VSPEESSDFSVRESLKALGVSLVTEWDTLAFLCSHAACLVTAAQISRLIGYEKTEISAALHQLEAVGLIQRSRSSQGRRIYTYSEPREPGRHSCFLDLMRLAQHRTGRLLLLKYLKRPPQERRGRRDGGLRLA